MKESELSLKKIARKHKPVKQYLRLFLERYEELFVSKRYDKLTILEIGVGGYKNPKKGGGSVKMWAEYFPNSTIVCIDLNDKYLEFQNNVNFHQGSQTDIEFLNRLSSDYGGFDIVIDDASHITKNTIITFEALWNMTSQYYIIEDLHMKASEGTREYFEKVYGSDFNTKNLCVIQKT